MAVGLEAPDVLKSVKGVLLAGGACGVKRSGASDLMLMVVDEGAAVAGVFTKNAYCAAPVTIARKHLASSAVRALLVNSGNANAGTGEQGLADTMTLCEHTAAGLGIDPTQVLPFSTGVIGELLPIEKLKAGVDGLIPALTEDSWLSVAESIMTTDTLPKACSEQLEIDGHTITITGISKGSGMIHPDMATMLSFVATDAAVDSVALQNALASIADATFNCITVDGDTSTNDSFICVASGAQSNNILNESHPQWTDFYQSLASVSRYLAHAIIRDGEGATRFIEIEVSGGQDIESCKRAGFTVAHSPLVKTAFFAGDPNLGRILAAIGRSKIPDLDMNKVSLGLGGLSVVEHGEPSASYREDEAAKIMAREDVRVEINLGMGDCTATVWTTDLSYDYVKINAEYRS